MVIFCGHESSGNDEEARGTTEDADELESEARN
jgi:hypothetical protein